MDRLRWLSALLLFMCQPLRLLGGVSGKKKTMTGPALSRFRHLEAGQKQTLAFHSYATQKQSVIIAVASHVTSFNHLKCSTSV